MGRARDQLTLLARREPRLPECQMTKQCKTAAALLSCDGHLIAHRLYSAISAVSRVSGMVTYTSSDAAINTVTYP